MNEKRYQELAEKWLNGTINEAEKQEFASWYSEKGRDEVQIVPENFVTDEETHKNRIWNKIEENTASPVIKLKPRRLLGRIAVAASILLVVGVGSYFLFFNKRVDQQSIAGNQTPVNDAQPGRDAAVLTMADGRTVQLDSTTGTIAKKDGITIVNTSGLLSYQQQQETDAIPEFHTITTARGNQYQLQLPDGSKVWLNAGSSLKFPSFFTGSQRIVELTGEGYFEVAKNAEQPFHVKVNDMDVEVLGTHFNINSYDDEDIIRTTLLEGSVKVSKGTDQQFLQPGQQAQLRSNGNLEVVKNIDMDHVMAWKEGFFQFDHAGINEILRQLSRWYDVDVRYEGNIAERQFGGRINRKLKLSEVLKMLQNTGVHFKIEGKNLIVMP